MTPLLSHTRAERARRAVGAIHRLRSAVTGDVPLPPTERRKRQGLRRLFREHRHDVLIEAGTYLGDTVQYFANDARRIVSIEIDPELHAAAKRRFAGRPHIEILRGDALDLVPQLISGSQESSLVWLDGHFSGGITGKGELIEPAPEILERIAGTGPTQDLTIVVDDLRLFGRQPGFPPLDRLMGAARSAFPDAEIWAELDALVIYAASASVR
jgi:hypothetical protein